MLGFGRQSLACTLCHPALLVYTIGTSVELDARGTGASCITPLHNRPGEMNIATLSLKEEDPPVSSC